MLFVVLCDPRPPNVPRHLLSVWSRGLNATAWATPDRPRAEQPVSHQASNKAIQKNNNNNENTRPLCKARVANEQEACVISSTGICKPSFVPLLAIVFLPFLCYLKVLPFFFFRGGGGLAASAAFCVL